MINFTIYTEPVAQGRPRVDRRGIIYDPRKSKDYKTLVALSAQGKGILEGALSLNIKIYRSIPQSMSKKKKALAEAGVLRPTVRPDLDNYIKGILDGLNKVLWHDDSQIVRLEANKYYSDQPRIEVTVEQLDFLDC